LPLEGYASASKGVGVGRKCGCKNLKGLVSWLIGPPFHKSGRPPPRNVADSCELAETTIYLARGAGRGGDGEDAQHRHDDRALIAPEQLREMLPIQSMDVRDSPLSVSHPAT